jgi:hypothetical protein
VTPVSVQKGKRSCALVARVRKPWSTASMITTAATSFEVDADSYDVVGDEAPCE